MHISSIYAKILGGKLFRKREKKKNKRREKERLNDGNNNGQAMQGARMAYASRLGQFSILVNQSNKRSNLYSGQLTKSYLSCKNFPNFLVRVNW